ncbi:MAG: thioredoxin-dependent thiol peroxidase [Candidatus Thermoplasmatota archaeon]|nr:thioredoxin-dependent thiol peroxidase [Candidatus Thermoplasmatota archaeon]
MGSPITLEVGDKAPLFTAEETNGETISLQSLLDEGKRVVLYFYPKDSTPGCTVQACDFRDNMDTLSSNNVTVLGVSKGSQKSHANFIQKQNLNFHLLLDTEGKILDLYGSWREKMNYGRTFLGISRSTFVIETDGTLSYAKYGVKAKGHADRILKHLGLE